MTGGDSMSFFFNPMEGERLYDNSEAAVYDLFSRHYNVRRVHRISDTKYHVHLRDGKILTVATYPHTTIFGDAVTTVKYVSE